MNRSIHRILALLAVLLMLWMSVTGSWMQLLDLKTFASKTPLADPTQLSIIEGMYGQPGFAVVQVRDFDAEPLPRDLDIGTAVETVLMSHAAQPQQAAVGIDWLELRVVDHRVIGQVMSHATLGAFDAKTGAPVAAVAPQAIPQGRRLPPSLRQRLKTLHRFWSSHDTPGVYFEVLTGVVLGTLLTTGLIMYFKLLSARARIGRRQWFWLTGGTWRGLHRAVSTVAVVFLLCMAVSGTWIGLESSWSALWGRSVAGARSDPLRLQAADLEPMAATALESIQRLHPGSGIKVLRLRMFGKMPQAVFVSDGTPPDQWVFDTRTGQPASLTEPDYPRTNFPFGVEVHEDMKHFHSGAMFGIPARLMNLFAGFSLVFLSVSGLVVYIDLWLKRRKTGRRALVWLK